MDQPKAGRFYLLPKMHKAGNPGRPIVSANRHPTEKISEFVDLHLQLHVNSLPSYLKGTTDYLRKLQESGPITPETLLVSLDVTSLYTNIPHEHGTRACKEAWEERPVKNPPTETLVELLTFNSRGSTICRSKAQPWAQKWLQLMQISSWDGWKDNFSDQLV